MVCSNAQVGGRSINYMNARTQGFTVEHNPEHPTTMATLNSSSVAHIHTESMTDLLDFSGE